SSNDVVTMRREAVIGSFSAIEGPLRGRADRPVAAQVSPRTNCPATLGIDAIGPRAPGDADRFVDAADPADGGRAMAQIGGIPLALGDSDSHRPTSRAAPTPSSSAWCILPTTANPPPRSPSIT